MVQRGEDAENAGVADKGVEPAPAAIKRFAKPVDRGEVPQIHRRERCGRFDVGAEGADLVVELLERALRSGERNHMRAGAREGEAPGPADSARGAGDERDAGLRAGGDTLGIDMSFCCRSAGSLPGRGERSCEAQVAIAEGRRCGEGIGPAPRIGLRGFMGSPELKIKSKTTERNAWRRRSGPRAGLRAGRPWEGAIVLRVDMANANAGREQGKTVTRADLSEIVYQRVGLSRPNWPNWSNPSSTRSATPPRAGRR